MTDTEILLLSALWIVILTICATLIILLKPKN